MTNISPVVLRPLALLLSALCMLSPASAATTANSAARLPTEAFFKKPALGSPVLSPSGKKLAMLVPAQGGRVGLAVAEIATPDKFVGIAQFPDADIRSVWWVNDERLVFNLIDFQAPVGDQLGSGLYAVDADGSDFLWLIERTASHRYGRPPNYSAKPPLPWRNRLLTTVDDGSDDVLIRRYTEGSQHRTPTTLVLRLNTRTLGAKQVSVGNAPPNVQDWVLDRALQPRVATSSLDGTRGEEVVYYRDPGAANWSELYRYNAVEDLNNVTPVAIDAAGQLYVTAPNTEASDGTTALFRYDTKTKKVEDKPLVSLPGFDFDGQMLFDSASKALLGVTYEQEAPGTVWFEPGMRETQAAVDKLLPSTNNYLRCARCVGARHVVVTATSDIQAPVYFLYDRQDRKLKLLGQSRPWLKSTEMAGTQDFARIKARDGMEIPVYITKPKGKGPFPTVVLVHGGPFMRGNAWGFNEDAQFLASRGYLVVEPEFRGSRGYGSKLFRAGWKQWGLAMQDDVTDATKWAIAQGLADPARIAIAGASYGGYATMMGLLREPGLYKAGVNWVGVTDIEMMYTIGWSDFMNPDSPWIRYGMPRMMGDPSKDAAQLRDTSPLQQAARIKQPVLLAYGEEDYRVPLPHGTKMRDALRASGNQNVEWIQYASEGHGWMLTKNNVDFWDRVERFLGQHLK